MHRQPKPNKFFSPLSITSDPAPAVNDIESASKAQTAINQAQQFAQILKKGQDNALALTR